MGTLRGDSKMTRQGAQLVVRHERLGEALASYLKRVHELAPPRGLDTGAPKVPQQRDIVELGDVVPDPDAPVQQGLDHP